MEASGGEEGGAGCRINHGGEMCGSTRSVLRMRVCCQFRRSQSIACTQKCAKTGFFYSPYTELTGNHTPVSPIVPAMFLVKLQSRMMSYPATLSARETR